MSLGVQILVLVVYALAVMRLVRLINSDTILDPIRVRLAGRVRSNREIADEALVSGQTARAALFRRAQARWTAVVYFVGCPWCVGMWLAFLTAWVPLYVADNPVVQYIALALAVSHVVGVLARFADTEVIEVEDDDDQ